MSTTSIFTCACCHDIYEDPRLLKCGHTFCFMCLTGKEKCPECGEAITESDDPPKNFILQQWLDDESNIDRKPPALCANCEVEPGRLWCKSCQGGMHLCEQCSSDIHAIKAFRSHEPISADKKTTSFPQCRKHSKEMELFCKTCREFVCMMCVLGPHRQHLYEAVDSVAEEERATLQTSISKIAQYSEILEREVVRHQFEKKAKVTKRKELEKLLEKISDEIEDCEKNEEDVRRRMSKVSSSTVVLTGVIAKIETLDLMEPHIMTKMEMRIDGVVNMLFTPEERKKVDHPEKKEKKRPAAAATEERPASEPEAPPPSEVVEATMGVRSESESESDYSSDREPRERGHKGYSSDRERRIKDRDSASAPNVSGSSPSPSDSERSTRREKGPRVIQGVVAVKSSSQHSSCHRNHTLTPDLNQFWLSENGHITNQYLVYDFSRVRNIKRVQLRVAAFDCCPKDFYIETSTNADGRGGWKRVLACRARPGTDTTEWQTFEATAITTRYIRLYFVNSWDRESGAHILLSCVRFWE